jgi:hypothetical protein
MFIEGTYSWDREGERTSLEWPPFLSPGVAGDPNRGQPADEVGAAPDLTPAEVDARKVDARKIDSLVNAAFFAEDPAPPALGTQEDPGIPARHLETEEDPWAMGDMAGPQSVRPANGRNATPISQAGAARPDELDEDEDDDEWDRPPRRRLAGSKGLLIAFAMAVTVVLSGGYAAQAFGWRLPPTLRESAQPMKAFLRNFAPSHLASLMPAQVHRLRLRVPEHDGRTFPTPELVQPAQPATGSVAGSAPIPSETQASTVAVPSAQANDPRDRTSWVDPEPVGTSPAPVAGANEHGEQPMESEEGAASVSESSPSPGFARVWESTGTPRVPTRAVPVLSNRDHLPRPWHGLVWSPAAQALVPAVPVPQAQPPATLPRAPLAATPAR